MQVSKTIPLMSRGSCAEHASGRKSQPVCLGESLLQINECYVVWVRVASQGRRDGAARTWGAADTGLQRRLKQDSSFSKTEGKGARLTNRSE